MYMCPSQVSISSLKAFSCIEKLKKQDYYHCCCSGTLYFLNVLNVSLHYGNIKWGWEGKREKSISLMSKVKKKKSLDWNDLNINRALDRINKLHLQAIRNSQLNKRWISKTLGYLKANLSKEDRSDLIGAEAFPLSMHLTILNLQRLNYKEKLVY